MPKKKTAVDAAQAKLNQLGVAVPGLAELLLGRLRADHPELSDEEFAELLGKIKVGAPERTIHAKFGVTTDPATGAPVVARSRHLKLPPSSSEPDLLHLSRDATRAVIVAGDQATVLDLKPTAIEVRATHALPSMARRAIDGDVRFLAASGATTAGNLREGSLRVIDLETGTEVGGSDEAPHLLGFSPDGALWGITVTKKGAHVFADSALRWPKPSTDPTRWSLASAPPRLTQPFSFSADGKRAAYVCEEDAVLVSTDRFEPLLRFHAPALGRKSPLAVERVTLSPAGDELAVLCGAGPARSSNPLVLRVDTRGSVIETFNPLEAQPVFYALAYTQTGLRAAYVGKERNRLLAWASGDPKPLRFQFSDRPMRVTFSADGHLLLVVYAPWDEDAQHWINCVYAIALD